MTNNLNNPPAFPSTTQYFPEDTNYQEEQGMNLRDYFAAKAMSAIVANKGIAVGVNCGQNILAKDAYKIADAMLKERMKENDQ